MKHLLFTLLIAATIPLGCNSPTSTDEDKEESAKKSYVEKQAVKVAVQKVRQGAFARELVSNGKLAALEKAVVPFKVQEQIVAVKVKNGDRVGRGELLAKVK